MAIRRFWQSIVADKEEAALRIVDGFRLSEESPPVNLNTLLQKLNLQIRKSTSSHQRRGSLTRSTTQWVIHIPAHSLRSQAETRFTIAHEVAHFLLSKIGISIPVSDEEYWILESACDRVASYLLAPNCRQYPKDISPTNIHNQFDELCNTWLLPSHIAAKAMCQSSSNIVSAMSVTCIDDGHFSKGWEVTDYDGSKLCRWNYYIDSACIMNMLQELSIVNCHLASNHVDGTTVIGVRDYIPNCSEQLQFDFASVKTPQLATLQHRTAVFFYLSDSAQVTQQRLPL